MTNHIYHKCNHTSCYICSGSLFLCNVCGAAEGELLTYCPGYQLNVDTLSACYQGNVFDFTLMKVWKSAGYDIRKKNW